MHQEKQIISLFVTSQIEIKHRFAFIIFPSATNISDTGENWTAIISNGLHRKKEQNEGKGNLMQVAELQFDVRQRRREYEADNNN